MAASFTGFAQVGIGTTSPDVTAELDVTSTTKGFLPPRMTKVQMETISPTEGLIIYCTNCIPNGIYTGNGTAYISMRAETVNVPAGVTLAAGEVYTATGRIWMDKNLEATQVATSLIDVDSYGGFYQWGKKDNVRSSPELVGPVASNTGNFVTVAAGDWLSTPDDTRWNGATKGTEDPCPVGYRVPTSSEWSAEIETWISKNDAGAFASPLKLPSTGRRNTSGSLGEAGTVGYYWSSTPNGTLANHLRFLSNNAYINFSVRAYGFAVRCIKE